ncbi:MAG: hypothetical protein RLZZ444_3960 [Pseudomonadota bacterium]|jgi:hypothetical protein
MNRDFLETSINEQFKNLLMDSIWQNGEMTREEILNAVFCSLEAAIGQLETGGYIEIEPAPNRESHLDVFRPAMGRALSA